MVLRVSDSSLIGWYGSGECWGSGLFSYRDSSCGRLLGTPSPVLLTGPPLVSS